MVEIKKLSVCYGKNKVLDKLSLKIEKGSLTAIIGENGCGKSTLLKAASGILTPSEGEILIDGEKLSSIRRKEIARRISYLAQGKSTPDMTVRQLVLHGRFPHLGYPRHYSARDREISEEAMKRTGIINSAKMPLSALSGGMRQNAYISMALAQDTDYILLDEPTTYLDVSHQLEIMKLMRELAKEGKGVVAVMHELSLAMTFSDRVAVIGQGTVLAYGSPQEIFKTGIIKEVFGASLEENKEKNGYYMRVSRDEA